MTGASGDVLRSVGQRLETERLVARPVVARLRTALRDAWESPLPETWRTLGFVQELTASAASVLEQDPEHSRALAQFAIAVATAVPRESYPPLPIAYVEGSAWKELGTAHRYLSSYDASLRAYSTARRSFAAHGALAHDVAIVDLASAVTLCEAARFDEALDLISRTTSVFAEYGDHRRLVQSAVLRAMIHHRRGDLRNARSGYEEALQRARNTDDLHTLAAIHNNLGQASAELGDFTAAAASLTKARELFLQKAMLAEVARTDIALARLSMQKGDYAAAVELLERVRERFIELGMIDEAAFTGLEAVEALIGNGHRSAALQLTEKVLAESRTAGLNQRALIALSYLSDLLPRHPQPAEPIRHVRSFLTDLAADPDRTFVPLPE